MGGVVTIVPAYNEAESIGATIAALRSIPAVEYVLAVDDGSDDDTAARALRAGGTCISLDRNRGKGAALNAGVATVRGHVLAGTWAKPEAVLLADADLGASAELLGALIEPVLSGAADLAIADLPPQPGSGGFGVVKGLARWGLRANRIGTVREPLSGQRVMSWAALHQLWPFAPGFGVEVQMTLDALAANLTMVEITLPLTHAVTGKGLAGTMHRAAQAGAVAKALLLGRSRPYRLSASRYARALGARAAVVDPPRRRRRVARGNRWRT